MTTEAEIWARTVMVDFDGCIVEAKFPEIGDLRLGVKEALQKLRDEGFYVVIWSSRMSSYFESWPKQEEYKRAMVIFITENDIPHDEIDDGQSGKRPAIAYVDDAGIDLDDGWGSVLAKLLARQEARKSGS